MTGTTGYEAAFEEIFTLLREGHVGAAVELAGPVMEGSQNTTASMHLMGVLAHRVGNHGAAVEFLEKAAELAPESEVVLVDLADALDDLGEPVRAQKCRVQARELELIRQRGPDILLDPSTLPLAGAKRVLVLSCSNVGNFVDRMGYNLISSVLPNRAVVRFAQLSPWSVPEEEYDLLILGVGDSMFAPLLTDELFTLLKRVPKAVGIFGTRYRRQIDPDKMDRLLDSLTHWYARYEEDLSIYGCSRENVTHLGDWLVNQFPLAEGYIDDELRVGAELLHDLPLDRTIQKIQCHKRVFSTRLHPLLCALTSARFAAYAEEKVGRGDASGEFKSMLLDVFGREYPENRFWEVDREKVAAYREKVARNTETMKNHMANLLEPTQ